jgi:hypothetical protein
MSFQQLSRPTSSLVSPQDWSPSRTTSPGGGRSGATGGTSPSTSQRPQASRGGSRALSRPPSSPLRSRRLSERGRSCGSCHVVYVSGNLFDFIFAFKLGVAEYFQLLMQPRGGRCPSPSAPVSPDTSPT